MARDGLKADLYRDWITNSIEIDDFTNTLFSNFVIGTPSYGNSKKERNLYDYYGYKNVTDYEKLYSDLFGEITEFKSFDSYKELKEAIENKIIINFTTIPEVISECCYFYSGKKEDNRLYKAKFSNQSSQGKKKAEISNISKAKDKLVVVDKFFTHIRNGLAHGCFSIKEQDNECYYIIQDESTDHYISARMILRKSTLERIINYLEEREKEINKNNENESEKELCPA